MPATLAPKFIVNTLATAIAYLIIHTHQTWNTIIQDLVQSMSSNEDSATCLLQILKYMANDCDNESIVIEDSIRRNFYKFMDSVSRHLVFQQILEQWSQKISQLQTSPDNKEKIMMLRRNITDCFLCWIKLKLPDELFCNICSECPNLMQHVITELAHDSSENVEFAAKSVVELLKLANGIQIYDPIKQYVISKEQNLIQSASIAIQKADQERAEYFSMIFTEIALMHKSDIIESGSTQVMDILVKLLEQIPELSPRCQLTFWKPFFRALSNLKDQKQAKLEQFGPILLRLLGCLCQKAKIPDYLFSELNIMSFRDELFDDVSMLRRDLGSLTRNLTQCCGSTPVIQYVAQKIAAARIKINETSGDEHIEAMCELESGLFVMTEACKTIKPEELKQLYELVELIYQLPKDYVAIRLQSTEFFVAISHLLHQTPENQTLVPNILKYVLEGFTDIELTLAVSSYCFQILCKENAQQIGAYAHELVQQVLKPDFVENFNTEDKFADVMRGFGCLIPESCKQNPDNCSVLLKEILQPLLLPVNLKVQQFISVKQTGDGKVTGKDLHYIADKIMLMGDFLKYCTGLSEKTPQNQINPMIPILNEIWPFLEQVLTYFIMDDDIIEYVVRMVKHITRATGNQFLPLLQPFLKGCMNGYKQNQLGTFVYAVEFMFMEYGHQPQHIELFLEALDFIIKSSTEYLIDQQICEQNPNLVSDIFGMTNRYIRYNKKLFFRSTQLEAFVKFMLMCIGLNQFKTAKSHSDFMLELLRGLRDDLLFPEEGQENLNEPELLARQQQMWQYIRSQGANIMQSYIKALLDVPPREVGDHFVDVLVELCSNFIADNECSQWLQVALAHVPNNVLTDENKVNIVNLTTDQNFRRGHLQTEFDILSKRARSSALRNK